MRFTRVLLIHDKNGYTTPGTGKWIPKSECLDWEGSHVYHQKKSFTHKPVRRRVYKICAQGRFSVVRKHVCIAFISKIMGNLNSKLYARYKQLIIRLSPQSLNSHFRPSAGYIPSLSSFLLRQISASLAVYVFRYARFAPLYSPAPPHHISFPYAAPYSGCKP